MPKEKIGQKMYRFVDGVLDQKRLLKVQNCDTYILIDEAQNLTVSQALAIITRAGENTKVVFLGDPDQVDAKYLDRRNNGLVFASDRMKGTIQRPKI